MSADTPIVTLHLPLPVDVVVEITRVVDHHYPGAFTRPSTDGKMTVYAPDTASITPGGDQ